MNLQIHITHLTGEAGEVLLASNYHINQLAVLGPDGQVEFVFPLAGLKEVLVKPIYAEAHKRMTAEEMVEWQKRNPVI